MNKTICMFAVALLFFQCSMAKTFITQSKGYWFSSSTWKNGIAPAYTFSDTVIIQHPVDFDKNIFMKSGAYMRIDTSGGLCGHHTITVYSNAMIYKYGLLQLDSMLLISGKVILDGPKDAIFSESGIIKGAGASMYVKGCKLSVGPWFQCTGDEYESTISTIRKNGNTTLYPNPTMGTFKVQFYSAGMENILRLTDMQGKLVMNQTVNTTAVETVNISSLPAGIYCWQLISDGQPIDQGRLSLLR